MSVANEHLDVATSSLAGILRLDRVAVADGNELGIVQYIDDECAVVLLDSGLELTCGVHQIQLAGQ